MRAARRAGTRQARIATATNVAVVDRITRRSEGATPYRYDPSSRPAVSVAAAPNPTPAIASHSPFANQQRDDCSRRTDDRQADADFPGAAGDDIGQHAVQAERR